MVARSFSVDTREVTRLADAMGQQAGKIVRDEMTTAMTRSTEHVQREANALVKHRGTSSGSIAGSWKKTLTISGKGMVGLVENVAKHAKWVNNGRGAIVAIRARALRFTSGGKVLFRKRVGPAAAQHFMERGLDRATAPIQGEFNAAARRIADRLSMLP